MHNLKDSEATNHNNNTARYNHSNSTTTRWWVSLISLWWFLQWLHSLEWWLHRWSNFVVGFISLRTVTVVKLFNNTRARSQLHLEVRVGLLDRDTFFFMSTTPAETAAPPKDSSQYFGADGPSMKTAPHKKNFRQRAHCNPLSQWSFD